MTPTRIHRPDVKPGRGYRILNLGEKILEGDEVRLPLHQNPFKLGWFKASDFKKLLGQPVTQDDAAVRTSRSAPENPEIKKQLEDTREFTLVALVYAASVRSMVSAGELEEIREANRALKSSGAHTGDSGEVCASADFVDSNVLMIHAITEVLGDQLDSRDVTDGLLFTSADQHEALRAIWENSFVIAKALLS